MTDMRHYLYPRNLRADATIWFWRLKDFVIITLGGFLSLWLWIDWMMLLPMALTMAFAFLTIRLEDTAIMDYVIHIIRYFVTQQQVFYWREPK